MDRRSARPRAAVLLASATRVLVPSSGDRQKMVQVYDTVVPDGL